MMVRIRRGSHEVGGSSVEIEHHGDRLVLDTGWTGRPTRDERAMLPTGFVADDGLALRLRGVLVAHAPLGSDGVVDRMAPRVPVYLGRQAAAIASASRSLVCSTPLTAPAGYLEDRQPLHLGPFTITPQLVDHCGVDAFALIIDAGAERLFVTGPLRGHGRDVSLFERLVVNPPTHVDTLLVEDVPVPSAQDLTVTESQLEVDMTQTFLATDGLAVVVSAAQHLDRLVTAYRACLRSGRTLLVDLYAATIARASGRPTLPQPGFPQLGVYVPARQQHAVESSGERLRIEAVATHRVRPDEIAAHPDEFVVLSGPSTVLELLRSGALTPDGVVVWSEGPGSRRDEAGAAMVARLASAAVPVVRHHTSGRPRAGDLARLVAAVGPRQVVAMGTGAPGVVDGSSGTGRVIRPGRGWWPVDPTAPVPLTGRIPALMVSGSRP